MADRDELIDQVESVLPWRNGPRVVAERFADGGYDLGGGRRIAIIEQTVVREAISISHADDGWHGETRPLFRIVTPDPEDA